MKNINIAVLSSNHHRIFTLKQVVALLLIIQSAPLLTFPLPLWSSLIIVNIGLSVSVRIVELVLLATQNTGMHIM